MYNEDSMQVKTYVGKHVCPRIWRENPNYRVAWLVKRYMDKFRLSLSMPITTFMETVKEERMVEIHLKTAYRVIAQCLRILEGSNMDQYTKLWGACKNGFKNGCRQFVGLDGFHLKRVFRGQLLSAVRMDANNQTWVIAYAIVELEIKDSWVWFLELLAADLEIVNQRAWTFIFDKQKGLIPAFEKVLPNCNHRFCVRHLYTNYKANGFKVKELKDALWNAAKATTIANFKESMAKVNMLNVKAYKWLLKRPAFHWSRSHFETHT
ncbi:uncharacterized protein [Pyrus communis]|uniref:uncharacterized protein n=1 Tax=Pyrus communis TaxID=23211 RepID=UPI0035C2192C